MPDGDKTNVGDRGENLSGGQRQRMVLLVLHHGFCRVRVRVIVVKILVVVNGNVRFSHRVFISRMHCASHARIAVEASIRVIQ